MRTKGLVSGVVGLGCLIWGCEGKLENLKPDRMSAGVAVRQIRGHRSGFRVESPLPVWQIQAKKKLTERLDAYLQGQYNYGQLSARSSLPGSDGEVRGHFEAVRIGLQYFFDDSHLLGLDWGAEAFHADYDLHGGLGPIKLTTHDELWGGGGNLGAVGEIPLTRDRRFELVWGAGYLFNAADTRRAHADLNSWYVALSFQINLSAPR